MSGKELKALRIHIGPVQSFIAAGRRTRDFWAGSFLLSRLTGEAMAEIIKIDGAAITIPCVYEGQEVIEPTLKAILDAHKRDAKIAEDEKDWTGPRVGTLVNHFRATIPAHLDITKIEEAPRKCFQRIAEKIYDHFIKDALDAYRDDEQLPAEPEDYREERAAQAAARWQAQADGSFFEILWVTGPGPSDDLGPSDDPGQSDNLGPSDDKDTHSWKAEARWLDRRKKLRIHRPIDETEKHLPGTGDRCPIHPELCELGGFSRIFEREQQGRFWECIRASIAKKIYPERQAGDPSTAKDGQPAANKQFRETLELREGERLSALALVKRLFPLLPAEDLVECIGWVPALDPDMPIELLGGGAERARQALRHWPSTAFIAAIPWIIYAGKTDPKAAEEYARSQYQLLHADDISQKERPQYLRIEGIDRLAQEEQRGDNTPSIPLFAMLDGSLHFRRGLEKHRLVSQRDQTNPTHKAQQEAKNLPSALNKNFCNLLCRVQENARKTEGKTEEKDCGQIGKSPARPFYAMLSMDGDSMGEIFSHSRERAENCSKALLEFAGKVPEIVYRHDGVLIFAGADDVEAMLPIDTAICCAIKIRAAWQEVMASHNMPGGRNIGAPTLSASIIFTDYQNALDDVRRLAHQRLNAVAKDGMGRDALALAIMKSGGITAEWASAWGAQEPPEKRLPAMFLEYARLAATAKPIAKRLPYLIRQRFTPIMEAFDDKDNANPNELFDDEQLAKFIAKEIGDSGLSKNFPSNKEGEARAIEEGGKIVALMRPHSSAETKGAGKPLRHIGGLLIANFLAENIFWPYFAQWKERRNADGGEEAP